MTIESNSPRPHGWDEWYLFAQDELELAHDESVEYANHRYVEERNREDRADPLGER